MLRSLTGNNAGDILPTFTGPGDVDSHREAVNGQHQQLNSQILPSNVSQEFKSAWGNYLQSWLTFYNQNKSANWLEKSLYAKSMYEQIDQFANQVAQWANDFKSAGGNLQGSIPSIADKPSEVTLSGITGLVVAGGALAAIIILGPHLTKGD